MARATAVTIILPRVPEPVLTDDERSALRTVLASQESWEAYLKALPCPDCADGDCEAHAA
jgi:hypothetical protein